MDRFSPAWLACCMLPFSALACGGGDDNPSTLGASGTGGGGVGGGAGQVLLTDGAAPWQSSDGSATKDGGDGAVAQAPKCGTGQVYCNGECFDQVGQTKAGCSLLYIGTGNVTDLALDAQYLYCADKSLDRIAKIDLASLAVSDVGTMLDSPFQLELDDTTIYFLTAFDSTVPSGDSSTVRKIAKTGGTATRLAQRLSWPGRLALGADNVYFTTESFSPFVLQSVPRSGASAPATTGLKVVSYLVDGTNLFYVDGSAGQMSGPLKKAPLADLSSGTELTQNVFASYMAADASRVYWFKGNPATEYMEVPQTGGSAVSVQKFDLPVYRWATFGSDQFLEAIRTDTSGVVSLPLAGGTLTPIVEVDRGAVRAMAANATHVYVAISNGKAIVRVARP